jgi:hypothetical protein
MRGSLVVALAIVGCAKPDRPAPEPCLPLPAEVRTALVAAPDGSALYWVENVREYDFDSEQGTNTRLVRFDLRTRQAKALTDHASVPLRPFDGGVLARRPGGNHRAIFVDNDGRVQELTPSYLDVLDIEVVDRRTLALLADGDGARAVYTLDIEQPRPEHLIDATALLSASAGRVYVRVDEDAGVAIDLETRMRQAFTISKDATPLGDRAVVVDGEKVVLQSLTSGERETVVRTLRPWKLVYQVDTVLARTQPKADESAAWLVAGGKATKLPTVLGGASILRTARAGTQAWALIGHNTTNYAGDLAGTEAEADVCVLPETREATFPTRSFPARYVTQGQRLSDAINAADPTATLQILAGSGDTTTVVVHLRSEPGGRDPAVMRERTRAIHGIIAPILDDREAKTVVRFIDGRLGVHRWRRDRLRHRTSVGMGDALMSDPADFDFEVSDLENEKQDDKISCAGTLQNLTAKPVKIGIKCSGNRAHVIELELQPNERKPFSQTFVVSDVGEAAFLEVIADGKPQQPRYLASETRSEAVFALATEVYAATALVLFRHNASDDGVRVELEASPEFLQRDRPAQDETIKKAYEQYAGLRGIYRVDPRSPLRLELTVELSDAWFAYDGTTVTRH